MENIFNLPGLGRLLLDCTRGQRLPGGLRSEPVFRHRSYAYHFTYRPDLSLFGPQGPLRNMSDTAEVPSVANEPKIHTGLADFLIRLVEGEAAGCCQRDCHIDMDSCRHLCRCSGPLSI